MTNILLLAVMACAGVFLRVFLTRAVANETFPWAILAANLLGCFGAGVLLALLKKSMISQNTVFILGAGFLGALTTFSTYASDTLRLMMEGDWRSAALNLVLNNVLGLAICFVGWRGTNLVL